MNSPRTTEPSPTNSNRLTDVQLRLGGIACVACTDLIERDLKTADGVVNPTANYTLRRAFLQIDPSKISVDAVIKRIEKLGYYAYPESANEMGEAEKQNQRREFFRMLVAVLLMMQSMMFMYPYYFEHTDMDMSTNMLMRWSNLFLTLPAVFYCALPIFRGAWAEWRLRQIGMDTPVTIAIWVAFIASTVAVFKGEGHLYFDSVTMFVALLLVVRYIQNRALSKAGLYLNNVLQHQRLFAERVQDYPTQKNAQLIPAEELKIGDVIFIASGEVVPHDAELIEGQTACSQALLTGESVPITKRVGDVLLAGSMNIEQGIYARITQSNDHSELAAIERLAHKAALHKPALALLAEKAARVFLWGLLLVSAGAGLYWYQHDPSRVVEIVVAVLVITCPCALALAVPTVMTAAQSALAERHVLVIQPEAIEKLAKVNQYVFDKTGTLTEDVQTLHTVHLSEHAVAINMTEVDALQIAATLEAASRHPIALALRKALQDYSVPERMNDVMAMELVVGQGVTGTLLEKHYRIGKPPFALNREPLTNEIPTTEQGYSVAVLSVQNGDTWDALAWFALSDRTRTGAQALIKQLQKTASIALVSGDKTDVVQGFAHSIGLDAQNVVANAHPQDKLDWVRARQAQGYRIAMTGDGLNDAPVLQQADVAIAMGQGASLAQMQADLVVQSSDLNDIYAAHMIARRTQVLIKENLVWAVLYNVIAIPLAAMGWVTPIVATIGMLASSMIVVTNSLRILRYHPNLNPSEN
ncbi:MAG: cation-translocating P-type ATPase [Burkholderiales bacterium]|nr:cation-translocating P-type ATPase [Burkholderiales bacterium]